MLIMVLNASLVRIDEASSDATPSFGLESSQARKLGDNLNAKQFRLFDHNTHSCKLWQQQVDNYVLFETKL